MATMPGMTRIPSDPQLRAVRTRNRALHGACFAPLWWALFSSSPLLAVAQVTATSEYLQRMDADADGRVSLPEYLDWMSYAFDARDLNHDAVLSVDELPGGKGQPLSREQHRERLAATFRKQDVDRDGFLSAKELAAPPQ